MNDHMMLSIQEFSVASVPKSLKFLEEGAVSLERSTTTTVRKRLIGYVTYVVTVKTQLICIRVVQFLMEWLHGSPQSDAPEITMACQTRTIVPGKEEDKTVMLIDER